MLRIKAVIKEVEKIGSVIIEESKSNLYDIVGKVNDYYIAKIFKGLKRVKIGKDNIKNIGGQIIIDKL